MNKLNRILWGTVLIIAGTLFALNSLNITDINLFFDGWWTLFILIPCIVGLFTEREKTGNLLGIAVAVFLFLCCREVLSFSMFWQLLVPVIIVVAGLRLILSSLFDSKISAILDKQKKEGKAPKTAFAAFSGNDINYGGEIFEGVNLTAVFGGLDCDLREAVITEDCVITVTVLFGGIDLLVPEGINVKSNTLALFGSTTNKTSVHKDAPTLYINGVCMFGGVELR